MAVHLSHGLGHILEKMGTYESPVMSQIMAFDMLAATIITLIIAIATYGMGHNGIGRWCIAIYNWLFERFDLWLAGIHNDGWEILVIHGHQLGIEEEELGCDGCDGRGIEKEQQHERYNGNDRPHGTQDLLSLISNRFHDQF
ncbi:hypothetical protein DSL72_008185 [Monilinia vaccinii-corymbosi]|uniref:Uncharacterized protein n=1 Tax=Monilinia vaccinii-corymbosi TaxID=61207 RepID=A0A8A3PK93_9HELO|nr:hypothetical protein DSL72_008185 [Monilinia vaccinii-corymbosi]